MEDCACLAGTMMYGDYESTELGMDDRYADVAIHRCRRCGRRWLHYHLEDESISRSGRWYRGLLEPGEQPSAENAATLLEGMKDYFAGGSYYDGKIGKRSGPPA